MTRKQALNAKVEYLTCDDELIISNIPVYECRELINKIYDEFDKYGYINEGVRTVSDNSDLKLGEVND